MTEPKAMLQFAHGDAPGPSAPGDGPLKSRGSIGATLIARAPLLLLLALLVVGIAVTPQFGTADNVKAILANAAIIGIVAVGSTFITISGNAVSLGVAQSGMLAAVVFLTCVGHGWNQVAAVLAVIALLVAVGVAQGGLVAIGLNPVVVTLAAGAIVLGVVAQLTGGNTITSRGANIGWIASTPLGIPLSVYVFAVVTAIGGVLSSKTVLGRRFVLLGANRSSASFSGLPVASTIIWAFVLLSVCIAIAGIIAGGGLRSANLETLSTLSIDVAAAVLVGGTAIQGGEGSALRSAAGACVIAVANNVMLLNGFSPGVRQVGAGLIVLVVVVFLALQRGRTVR